MREPREAKAYAPSHITGFFQIFENGSTGAGLNTADGARTYVRLYEGESGAAEIFINGKRSEAPVSQSVIDKFGSRLPAGKMRVEHEIAYPIGYGMGMSGAGAFSLAIALNSFCAEPLSKEQTMELAVRAEIDSGTGLGDVVAQQFHGIMIGLKPYPSRTVEILPSDKEWVVCAFFEPLETKTIIRNAGWVERINMIGAACMEELLRDRSVDRFMELSRKFTLETELANDLVLSVLKAVPQSSMAMLGQTAFLICQDPEEGRALFRPFTEDIFASKLADQGAHLL